MEYFVLRLERGGPWDWSRDMREQDGWDEHAAFMDDLADKGSIILGGPLEGDRETMHVIAAESEQAVRDLFATDPWWLNGMLRPVAIERWTILLDGREQLTLPWDEGGWRETVDAWIVDTLADLEIGRMGAVDHFRRRPWAALARVPTVQGDLYFKADAPSEAYEPALTEWLAGRRPDLVPEVLQIDAKNGWLLTRQAGSNLFDHIADPPDAAIWGDLLPLCAELQIELAASVEELLALGVPDSRPEALGRGYEDLLSRWPSAVDAPAVAEIADLIERLGDTIPASLTHEEFHDHNILLRDGAPVIIDWAEAVIEHPFCGLVNTFRSLVDRWGFEAGAPDLLALRDAYLEPWTTFAPLSRLTKLFEAAYPLGMLCRAVSWDRLLAELPADERGEFDRFAPVWLGLASETLEGKARLGS